MKTVNLQNTNIKLVFMNNRGEKEWFDADIKNSDLLKGEIVFTIPTESSIKILEFQNKSFWINSYINGIETVIYQGIFDNSNNYNAWLEKNKKENEILVNKKEEINQISKDIISNNSESSVDINNINTIDTSSIISKASINSNNVIKPNKLLGIDINEKKIDKLIFDKGITIKDISPIKDTLIKEKISEDMNIETQIKTNITKL